MSVLKTLKDIDCMKIINPLGKTENKLIYETELQVTVAVHSTQVPRMSAKISIDGKIVDIFKIMPSPPAGVIVVNRIVVR